LEEHLFQWTNRMNSAPSASLVCPSAPADSDLVYWFEQAIAVAPDAMMVECDGKRLETFIWGNPGAPGLLLLHGNMANAHWWRFIAPGVADRHRVVAFSFSGMGGSSHQPPYTLERYAAEAIAVAAATGLARGGPFSVAGHSAGGGVAAVLAASHGRELRRAIMIDSLIAPEGPYRDPPNQPSRIYDSREAAVSAYRLVPPQPERNRFIIDWLACHSLAPVEGGWRWSFDPLLRGRFAARPAWNRLADAKCPLLFINGARSRLLTSERIAALREVVPQANFLTVPDAHHHVLIDQPLALAALLGAVMNV
jgi:pimeloyl-ACP methyl ester carboxylesterase